MARRTAVESDRGPHLPILFNLVQAFRSGSYGPRNSVGSFRLGLTLDGGRNLLDRTVGLFRYLEEVQLMRAHTAHDGAVVWLHSFPKPSVVESAH